MDGFKGFLGSYLKDNRISLKILSFMKYFKILVMF
jgi:hypothetical protein